MSKPSCPFATLSYFSRSSSTPWSPTPQCVSWQKNVMATIKTVRPSILIMISDHYGYTSDWYAALRSMVTKVSPFAGKVVVIGQIPNLQNGTAACLARHASNIQLCSSPASQAIQTGYIAAEKQAAGETGATYVDLTPWFCTSTCTALIHKTVVYYDRAHITLSFGSYLEPALYQTLRNANVFTSAPG
ncbi:MAG: SGNH hydrolase domain-containing protein [Acidimicrobiales bacterium]